MEEKTASAAVMFTDIFGYTRMMGEDEPRTLRLLAMHKSAVEGSVAKHRGEIVKMIGDAFLVCFDEPAGAIACALEIQQEQFRYNSSVEATERFMIRIGVHFGSITRRDNDVFGSGVNVASRIEPLATPGGVCITEPVYQLCRNALDLETFSLGRPKLKNVAEPPEVLHLLTAEMTEEMVRREQRHRRERERRQKRIVAVMTGVAIPAVIALAVIFSRPSTVGLAPELPEVPLVQNRVAILPLRNETGDSTKAYLAQGVSDQLIFQLSRIKDLYVFPLSDVLSLSERHRNVNGIRRGLGAKYLVLGTLMQRADSMIVLLEIVDTERAQRVLSEEYKSDPAKLTQIQNKICEDIIYQLLGRISGDAEAVLNAFSKTNEMASDLFLRARYLDHNAESWHDVQSVIRLYEQAIQHDSLFALARAQLALACAQVFQEWSGDSTWLNKAVEETETAKRIAPDLAEVYTAEGACKEKRLDYAAAEKAYVRALRIRPDYRDPRIALGNLYMFQGRLDEAELVMRQSADLSDDFGDKYNLSKSLYLLAGIQLERADLDQAAVLSDSALSLATEIGAEAFKNEITAFQGSVVHEYGDYAAADSLFRKAYETARLEDRYGLLIRVCGDLAALNAEQGQIREALDYLDQAFAINSSIQNPANERWLYHRKYYVCAHMGDVDQMQLAAEKALSIGRELNDLSGITSGLSAVADVKVKQGNHEGAELDLLQALDYCRKMGNFNLMDEVLDGLATVYDHMQLPEQALRYQRMALAQAVKAGQPVKIAIYSANAGVSEFQLGHLNEAIRYNLDASVLFDSLSYPMMACSIRENVGYMQVLTGEYDQAEANLNEAISGYHGIGYTAGEYSSRIVLEDLLIRRGDFERADAAVDSLLEMGAELQDQERAQLTLLRLRYAQDRYSDCVRACIEYLEADNALKHELWIARIYLSAARARLNSSADDLEASVALLDSLRNLENLLYTCEGFAVMAGVYARMGSEQTADSLKSAALNFAEEKDLSGESKRVSSLMHSVI